MSYDPAMNTSPSTPAPQGEMPWSKQELKDAWDASSAKAGEYIRKCGELRKELARERESRKQAEASLAADEAYIGGLLKERKQAEAALRLVKETQDYALPKFNWRESFLDARAIDLLNRSALAVDRALSKPVQEPAERERGK